MAKDLLDHTVRIAELEETVATLTTTTKDVITDNILLKNTIESLETLQQQVTAQGDLIEALNTDPPK